MLKFSKITVTALVFLFYLGIALYVRARFSDTSSLIGTIEAVYVNIGYPLIFFGALFESMFLVGLFIPGSIILLLGASLSKIGILSFLPVFLLGTSGLVLGYTINYFLGKYGWYHALTFLGLEKGIDKGKEALRKQKFKALFLGYIMPGSGALLSTASGIINTDFKKFLLVSILGQSFWSLIWGALAYFFGIELVEFVAKYFIFVVILILAVWGTKKFIFKK